jgi:hypothetical protein
VILLGFAKNCKSISSNEAMTGFFHTLAQLPFNAGIKSLYSTLPAEIFTGDFNF